MFNSVEGLDIRRKKHAIREDKTEQNWIWHLLQRSLPLENCLEIIAYMYKV